MRLLMTSCGYGSTGEELTLAGILEHFGRELVVASFSPEETTEQHLVSSIGYDQVNPEELEELIVAGTGLFFDNGADGFASLVIESKARGIPASIHRVGVDQLNGASRILTMAALTMADSVTFRDKGSLENVRDIGLVREDIQVLTDFSLLAKQVPARQLLEELYGPGPYCGVSLKFYPEFMDFNKLAVMFGSLAEKYTLVSIPMCYHKYFPQHRDIYAISQVENMIGVKIHRWPFLALPFSMARDIIAGLDLLYTQRYHAALLGHEAGIPCYFVAFQPAAFRSPFTEFCRAPVFVNYGEVKNAQVNDNLDHVSL